MGQIAIPSSGGTSSFTMQIDNFNDNGTRARIILKKTFLKKYSTLSWTSNYPFVVAYASDNAPSPTYHKASYDTSDSFDISSLINEASEDIFFTVNIQTSTSSAHIILTFT